MEMKGLSYQRPGVLSSSCQTAHCHSSREELSTIGERPVKRGEPLMLPMSCGRMRSQNAAP